MATVVMVLCAMFLGVFLGVMVLVSVIQVVMIRSLFSTPTKKLMSAAT